MTVTATNNFPSEIIKVLLNLINLCSRLLSMAFFLHLQAVGILFIAEISCNS